MTRLWLRLQYGFEMVNAYLAEIAGEDDLAVDHLCRAQKIAGEIELFDLNRARGLFD